MRPKQCHQVISSDIYFPGDVKSLVKVSRSSARSIGEQINLKDYISAMGEELPFHWKCHLSKSMEDGKGDLSPGHSV